MKGNNDAGAEVRDRLTPAQILDVALPAFAERGFRGTTLGDVSAQLGVTRQALYYYFPKKQDLLVAIFEEFFKRLSESADAASLAEKNPSRRFEAMFEAHLRQVAAQPSHSAVFTTEFEHLPYERQRSIREQRRRYNDRFVAAYQDGIDAGQLRPIPAPTAVSLLLGIANWTYWWYEPGGDLSIDQLAEMASTIAFRGCLDEAPKG